MKKEILALSLLAVSALSGCSNIGTLKEYDQKVEVISFPELNHINTTSTGDNMVSQGSLKKGKAIKTYNSETTSYYISEGESFIEKYNDKYYISSHVNGLVVDFMSKDSKQFRAAIDIENNKLCVYGAFGSIECNDSNFEIIDKEVKSPDNFQQNLLYLGMPEQNKIVIGYREFKSDMARSSFSNDVTYNLDLTNEIAYKGAVIEIISATPSEIKYIVKRNFN